VGELTKHENDWQDRATAAAIAGGRRIVLGDAAVIPMNTPVGRLSDVEWGWIIAAVLFAWISVRAEQATAEGLDVEHSIRDGVDGAWDAGAITVILPRLADAVAIDWRKPLADWPRETMVQFLTTALALACEATTARDLGGGSITRKTDDTILTV
jgi:hypothetical protein